MNEADLVNSEFIRCDKAGNFDCLLALLIRKADRANLRRLYSAFPNKVKFVCEYYGQEYRLSGLDK